MHLLVGRAPQEQRKGVTLSVGFYYEFTTGLVSFESLHISKRQKKDNTISRQPIFQFHLFLETIFQSKAFYYLRAFSCSCYSWRRQLCWCSSMHWLSVWNTNTSCDQLCRLHGTWHFVRGRVDPGKDASVSVQGYHMHTHTHTQIDRHSHASMAN